jgi:tetratricopeptide (TPR) repeat protein
MWAGLALATEPGCDQATLDYSWDGIGEACTKLLAQPDIDDATRAHALKFRARQLHKQGRLTEAGAEYERALALAPDDAELHLRRGAVAVTEGRHDLALERLERALQLKPDYASAYELLGLMSFLHGDIQTTWAHYRKAKQLDPNAPWIRLRIARLYSWSAQTNAALAEWDAILALPNETITKPFAADWQGIKMSFQVMALTHRAGLLAEAGRTEEAARAYDMAVANAPSAMTYASRASFRRVQGAPDNIVTADIDQALKLDPDNWFAWHQKGIQLFEKGERELALAAHRRVIELQPNKGSLRWRVAQTLKALHRSEEAIQEAYAALHRDPEFLVDKYVELHKRGYLLASLSQVDDWALRDAAAACMIDEACR